MSARGNAAPPPRGRAAPAKRTPPPRSSGGSHAPMTPPPPQHEAIRRWIATEVDALVGVLSGQNRARTYRHHIFFIRAAEVLRCLGVLLATKQCRPPPPPHDTTTSTTTSTTTLLASPSDVQLVERFLRKCVRAGEEAANELRTNRVDTVPLALALLAIMARLHWLLSIVHEAMVQHPAASLRIALRDAKVAVAAEGAPSTTSPQGRHARREANSGTAAAAAVDGCGPLSIGGLIDVLVTRRGRTGPPRASGVGKRKRPLDDHL